MARSTIDFGIDLGTTNSAIAVLKGKDVEVLKNNENSEITPSAIWIDRNGRLFIGRRAKERLEDDPANAKAEFKLQMGTDYEYMFARSGQVMRPENLSAEVLKSLRGDVMQRMGEDLQAAVITVPAAFELHQCDATKKAAQLAGFSQTLLLQEPVAAAQAYGFQDDSEKVFWLVYDLGGGTFDAAVIQVRDGMIRVVNHDGDNQLGGKLIDWAIVDQLLVPAVVKERPLTDFKRGNPKWMQAIAKLKYAAEEAKIRLSRDESTEIVEDFLCLDDRGEMVQFEYELRRSDVEKLAEPFIIRSINHCKKVLAEKRLGTGDVEKVLLVGGPTLMPYLRERLLDRSEGLGIPLEFGLDPLTVVARGAAIFAGAQRFVQDPSILETQLKQGVFTISFPNWQFKGSETEPLVAGVVKVPAGVNVDGLTVEFINLDSRPQWRSGKLGLAVNNGFMTNLWAEKGAPNRFQVDLYDSTGRPQQVATDPESLSYQVGAVVDQPLTHSVGVALVNSEMQWLLEKGQSLPARKMCILQTAYEVRQGHAGDMIRVPVMEGGNERADRNTRIGTLEIRAHQVRRDVPVGSDVEITIEIDSSRIVRTRAYIPILDEEYEEIIQYSGVSAPDPERIDKEVRAEKSRLEKAREKVDKTADPRARAALERIEAERVVHDVETSLSAAGIDPDAADKANKRLLDLKVAIDDVETALEWPILVDEAESLLSSTRELVDEHGDRSDKEALQRLEGQVKEAILSRDPDVLRRRVEDVRRLAIELLDRKGVLQVLFFQSLSERTSEMSDRSQPAALVAQGQRAMHNGDNENLKAVNRQLAALLPNAPVEDDVFSTLGRRR